MAVILPPAIFATQSTYLGDGSSGPLGESGGYFNIFGLVPRSPLARNHVRPGVLRRGIKRGTIIDQTKLRVNAKIPATGL